MSEAGDRLKRRHASILGRVKVPELADAIGSEWIYFEPFTLADMDGLAGYLESDEPKGYLEIVLRKARREDRSPMFDRGDMGVLEQCVEFAVLKRIGLAIISGPTVEEARGNSEAIRSLPGATGSHEDSAGASIN